MSFYNKHIYQAGLSKVVLFSILDNGVQALEATSVIHLYMYYS